MPYYMMLTKLTDAGRKTLMRNPGRLWEVNKEVEAYGIKVVAQYVVLGQYDFINVLEAPDNEAIAKLMMDIGSRGTLTTSTLSALTLDQFIKTMSK